jgi:DNA-binding transcriptional LysR family regulator
MDLAALRIFQAVVAEGGVARAAAKLNRVQSNVTTRIKQLEASLGVGLFIRDGKRLILSPAGKVLLNYAERMLRLAAEATLAVKSGEPAGTLRVGTLESTAASRLPPVLGKYHRRHPSVRLELITAPSAQLVQAVHAYEVDAAIVADPAPSDALHRLPVFDEQLVVVADARQKTVRSAKDIAGKTIIAFKVGCAYRKRLENWLAESDLAPERILELGSYHAILACAAAGTGVAIVPRSVLNLGPKLKGVSIHSLPARVGNVKTMLIWRKNYDSAALRALVDVLTEA